MHFLTDTSNVQRFKDLFISENQSGLFQTDFHAFLHTLDENLLAAIYAIMSTEISYVFNEFFPSIFFLAIAGLTYCIFLFRWRESPPSEAVGVDQARFQTRLVYSSIRLGTAQFHCRTPKRFHLILVV